MALTREDAATAALLQARGFDPVVVPVLVEGASPEPSRLADLAKNLERFDWVVCASPRSVRAIADARGDAWPRTVRTAAVGSVTADAIRTAGGAEPIVGTVFTADGLFDALKATTSWTGQRVLVTTVAGGRRTLIDGLRQAGADVTEVEPYRMLPNSADQIRSAWHTAQPNAAVIGSAETGRTLIDAIGTPTLNALRAVVAIGPTTAAAMEDAGVSVTTPSQATFASVVDHLATLRSSYRGPA